MRALLSSDLMRPRRQCRYGKAINLARATLTGHPHLSRASVRWATLGQVIRGADGLQGVLATRKRPGRPEQQVHTAVGEHTLKARRAARQTPEWPRRERNPAKPTRRRRLTPAVRRRPSPAVGRVVGHWRWKYRWPPGTVSPQATIRAARVRSLALDGWHAPPRRRRGLRTGPPASRSPSPNTTWGGSDLRVW